MLSMNTLKGEKKKPGIVHFIEGKLEQNHSDKLTSWLGPNLNDAADSLMQGHIKYVKCVHGGSF